MNALNRRHFFKNTLLAGVAAGGFSRSASAAGAAPAPRAASQPPRISILSYSFRGLLEQGKIDVFGYLESCKYRYGLSLADIWSGFLTSTDEAYLKKVRQALDERELVLADLCVDKAHIWEDDEAARRQNQETAKAHLRAAEILGARFVRIDAGCRADTWTNEQFDYIAKQYQEYAQWARDHGFRMGAENHWGTEGRWSNLRKLYQAVNHPGFGLSIHIGGWQGSEAEKSLADREVAPWVCHTHFAWNICEGALEEKMENLRQAGYAGSYSVEHHTAKNEYANVAIQLARVRAVFDRWRSEGKAW